jgi:hypothetical protein
MSTNNPQRKKTVVVTKKSEPNTGKERLKPTSQRTKTSSVLPKGLDLLFGWSQYKFMLIGVGLIAVGMLLMLGGSMPSPDVWDDSLIYSFRRTTLAPIFIVVGLLVEVYAIFKD